MKTLCVKEPGPLLAYLYKNLTYLNKTRIRQTLKFGSVLVNGRVVTSHSHPLKAGDRLEVLSKEAAATERYKTEMTLQVIYEDRDIIVVEKPAGLLTMGSEKEKERTLYFMLTRYLRMKTRDAQDRVFIVHRLDRDASGLVVFAKTGSAKDILQENWGTAVKKYYAITEGVPEEKEGEIKSELMEDEYRRVYSVPKPAPGSKRSVTRYRVIGENESLALLEVTPETGRKNQIRVHLSDIGHPIAGDSKYKAKTDPMHRLALHAFYLEFPHPVTGELKTFVSKLPPNFKKTLDRPATERPS